ncbi:hypothetical protein VCSRO19_0913 [Vibrio cholerae]|uniref:hypothetical protein n=1 Tax=Vibrio cholerae TaxID=666 RepID=UPI0011D9991A|nr:hypothetical protein [Vibrio cholerae]TXZ85084.1 hypothetical protein FXE50_21250 [Vibrio cholerae]TYA92578.1 hypothetical protein FXE19_07040 [Vibrio cholerae]GIB73305.1 hypothetical protein VCSRO19_0913 [Vibrio cholerae]
MFDINKHRYNYFYNYLTVIEDLIPVHICDKLIARVNTKIEEGSIPLVNHNGLGNSAVSDLGGKYLHHIFKGDDVREYLPELEAIYHSILPIVSMITCTDTVVSPYKLSDMNIKAYPAGGGTLGLHYDTNGITVLLFLTENKEAPLRVQIPRSHPSQDKDWIEHKKVYAKKGALLIMQGRKVLHDCEPTITEQKLSVILNYYERHDTYRHEDFDNFVYFGKKPKELTETAKDSDISLVSDEELEDLVVL